MLYPIAVFILIHTNSSVVVETFHFTQSRLEEMSSISIALEEIQHDSNPPSGNPNAVGGPEPEASPMAVN
jgi:hypothetical protein